MPSGKKTYGSKRGRPSDKAKPRSQHAKKSAKTTKKTARVLALAKARKIANAGRTKPPRGTEATGGYGVVTPSGYQAKTAKQAAKRRAKRK